LETHQTNKHLKEEIKIIIQITKVKNLIKIIDQEIIDTQEIKIIIKKINFLFIW
jgi:hypothetical protein